MKRPQHQPKHPEPTGEVILRLVVSREVNRDIEIATAQAQVTKGLMLSHLIAEGLKSVKRGN